MKIPNGVRKNNCVVLFLLTMAVCLSISSCEKKATFSDAAEGIPIQHGGRIQTLDSFARETVRFLTGKETWEKKSSVIFILDILSGSINVMDTPCVRIDYIELKEILEISKEKKYVSFDQLSASFPLIMSMLQNIRDKQKKDVPLSQLDQKLERLYSRLDLVGRLNSGVLITVIPNVKTGAWTSPYKSQGPLSGDFKEMMSLYPAGSPEQFSQKVDQWISRINLLSKKSFRTKMRQEILYYKLKPFFYSWIFYLAGFLLLMFVPGKTAGRITAGVMILIGFIFHTAGFVLRGLILSRPPVANMYESMIFMNWVLIICAGIFFLKKREYFFLTAGSLLSALIMIYADLLPVDSSLEVLAPVLRSNYWLTVHVMTIVSSYGIFGLTMALGHRHLFLGAINRLPKEAEKNSIHIITRLMQAGLIALGIGTVLGGVWANESWGRFWGWDPKETWALITFLGYMAVLHLRYARKLSNFGLAVSAVIGFLLVLMTWYGVNFILGKGLHSYGSGAGGMKWIIFYLAFEVCFFSFIFWKKKQ